MTVVVGEKISGGAHGLVHSATWCGTEVAVKFIHRDGHKHEREKAIKCLQTEYKVLRRMQHPNVVQMFGYCSGSSPMLLMAKADHDLVAELYHPLGGMQPDLARRLQIACGVCRGMGALHRRGVLHLDLKPANVLIATDGTPWVADFGVSKAIETTMLSVVGGLTYSERSIAHPKRFDLLVWADLCTRGPLTFTALVCCCGKCWSASRRCRGCATMRSWWRTMPLC